MYLMKLAHYFLGDLSFFLINRLPNLHTSFPANNWEITVIFEIKELYQRIHKSYSAGVSTIYGNEENDKFEQVGGVQFNCMLEKHGLFLLESHINNLEI